MKLSDLAIAVGRSAPAVIMLQRKYCLPVYQDYSEGYAILIQKIAKAGICHIVQVEPRSLHSSTYALAASKR